MTVIATTAALSCPLCGDPRASDATPELRDVRGGCAGTWRFKECARCGVQYLDPRPVTPADAYPQHYPQHSAPVPATIAARTPLATAIRRAVLRTLGYRDVGGIPLIGALLQRVPPIRSAALAGFPLLPPGPPRGTLLDVGSGNGRFLAFARLLGWRVVGIESDAMSASAARTLGLDAIHPSFDAAQLAAGSVDVVTASHVVEHLADPRAMLADIRRVLAPTGLLGIVVPNRRSLQHWFFGGTWRGLEPPRHLLLFDRARLVAVVRECGFEIVSTGVESLRALAQLDEAWMLRFGRSPSRFERIAAAAVLTFVDALWPSRGDQLVIWARRHAR